MIDLLDVEMRRAEQLRGVREFMSARSRRTLALGSPPLAILDTLSRLLGAYRVDLPSEVYAPTRPFAQSPIRSAR